MKSNAEVKVINDLANKIADKTATIAADAIIKQLEIKNIKIPEDGLEIIRIGVMNAVSTSVNATLQIV